MLKLIKAPTKTDLTFVSIEGGMGAKRHLADMGLVPGEKLKVLQNSGYGPVTVLIKGAKVALGHGLATKIVVEEE
ncbi:MAG: ferrous iron transport protein A [Nitrospinae bacterium]|nr:ferrous iron transport protein A [Nitrospinota bacterium]